jgi:hypothetical protein
MSQSDSQTEWCSDHPQVVKSTCGGRRLTYTGVDGVQIRDCAKCMESVRIDPDENTVEHV